jgi:hypothetical protein
MKSLGSAAFRGRPNRPDPHELGHPIPISFVMGRNDIAVIGITGLLAYRTGFAFSLIIVFADARNELSPLGSMHGVKMAQLQGEESPPINDQFQVALTFSDGSAVESSGGFVLEGQAGPSLTLLEGSGGGGGSHLRWYVEPLPPPGPIMFSCAWPKARIAFRHEVPIGSEVHDAASESKNLGLKT